MVHIEIKNFQAITHEVIEVKGFSALAGRSNIGKSTIIRAVKAALTGAPVDSYVRHATTCPRINGAKSCGCFCSVHIIGDGVNLLWEKGDSINRYIFNGQVYADVGRGMPDFLESRFALVKIGDEKESIQVADQFNPIFILNESGTVAADVLSDVAKLNQINVAMRLVEKDRKEANATRKVREKDVGDLKVALAHYDGLNDVVERVAGLEAADQQIEFTRVKVEQLESFIDILTTTIHRAKSLEKVNLINIPDINPLFSSASKFATLENFIIDFKARLDAVNFLSRVEGVIIPSISALLLGSLDYTKLVQWHSRIDLLNVFFILFHKMDSVLLSPLASLLNLKENYLRLVFWVEQTGVLFKKILQVETDLNGLTQEEVEVLKEFEVLGVCDKCSRPFSKEHECH